ncbi:DUF3253 domain-containing protein [Ponticaulis sp.]|uniref:DUF3253 domain-containing protein n=1 Tax=Ponticaulis sp. TaxID=2020902 RepID=UPI000B652D67|nr:DUF3253 domain-containing protein [Ponticaulis sp.]MAI90438.1 hypothetical protein [Ponticaulis sp.]OUY00139.1 MAG: hypothetical protein CBB65_08365 [Hyphomonadaceae bacterium TMED5]|tara:strand:+ start:54984 stop:55307 length:324 start_codon:yes stop_codon:yes gene_type:complete
MTDATEQAENSPQGGKNPVRDAILEQVNNAKEARTVSPEDVARAVSAQNWNKLIRDVRAEAVRLAKEGQISIYRKGREVDPDDFKGVWRLGLPGLSKPPKDEDASSD